jgi:hypothetical protein
LAQQNYHQRGVSIMAQGILPFKYETEKNTTGMTALAGFQDSGSTATRDMDATLVATNKIDALFSYKGYKAYQPLNTWWFEQAILLHTEFRDGNVPAGFEQLRVFKDALDCLPEEVKKVRLRSDTVCGNLDFF